MKPFAARNMFMRNYFLKGIEVCFIADPGTQRWVISNNQSRKILELCDGKKEINVIAEKIGISNEEAEYTIKSLENEGLIFNDEAMYFQNCSAIIQDTDIMALHLEITNQCNLRCTHCYLNSGPKKKNELNKSEIFNIVDQLEPGSGKKVCITGGEPFLHPDFFEILEYVAVTRGLEADIYTNALLIDDQTAAKLRDINDRSAYGINLQISIEGSDAEKNDKVRGEGVFEGIGKAINILMRHGLGKNIVLFVCLTKDNINQVQELVKMAELLKIKALKFSQWQKQGRTANVSWAEKSPSLEDWIRCGHMLLDYSHQETVLLGNFWGDLKNGAPFGFSLDGRLFPKFICNLKIAPRIDCEGNIWPCQVFVDKESIVGESRKQSLTDVFGGEKYKNLFKQCKQREDNISECQKCEWKAFCAGGCGGFAYAEHDEFNKKDYFCEVRKYWFEQYIANKIYMYRLQLQQSKVLAGVL